MDEAEDEDSDDDAWEESLEVDKREEVEDNIKGDSGDIVGMVEFWSGKIVGEMVGELLELAITANGYSVRHEKLAQRLTGG